MVIQIRSNRSMSEYALAAVFPCFHKICGNFSSLNSLGLLVRGVLGSVRQRMAAALGCVAGREFSGVILQEGRSLSGREILKRNEELMMALYREKGLYSGLGNAGDVWHMISPCCPILPASERDKPCVR